ncbi:MAG: ATP-binding protein [Candidatus Aenigmatarchaeota archaeon]
MYVEREIREAFVKVSNIYNIVAVVGPRQAGKTTFLKEQMKGQKSSYVLFDDPDARAIFEDDVKRFEKQYMEGYHLTVLDEVQYCNDAGRKLKYLSDMGRRVWLTSSSEIVLGKEILSYLVGRVSIIKLYPFSLTEFLKARGQKEVTAGILVRSIWEHMVYGGYPKVVTTEDPEMKRTILKDLYDTMILKDVARTFSIEDIKALEEFAKYISLSIGSLFSYESVSKELKMPFQTARKYLDAMEKSYLILRVLPFHTNKRKEITKQPKIYFVDTGLRNFVAKAFDSEPEGKLFENYVLSELIKLGLMPKHWRTKSKTEVDFVVERGNEIIPIEVKLNAKTGEIERSMRSFIAMYKPKTAIVVSYKGAKGETKVNGCRIFFTDVLGMRHFLGY